MKIMKGSFLAISMGALLFGASNNVVGMAEIKETLADLAIKQQEINIKLDNFTQKAEEQAKAYEAMKESNKTLQTQLKKLEDYKKSTELRLKSLEDKLALVDKVLDDNTDKLNEIKAFFSDGEDELFLKNPKNAVEQAKDKKPMQAQVTNNTLAKKSDNIPNSNGQSTEQTEQFGQDDYDGAEDENNEISENKAKAVSTKEDITPIQNEQEKRAYELRKYKQAIVDKAKELRGIIVKQEAIQKQIKALQKEIKRCNCNLNVDGK